MQEYIEECDKID